MAKRSKKRRDEAAEEADRLTSIAVGGYAEVVIVTEDDHDDPKTRTALIVNGVPHIEIEGRDIVDVLRKFADALDAAREGIES